MAGAVDPAAARVLERLPHAVIGVDGLQVVFANEQARTLLGEDVVGTGAELSKRSPLGRLAAQLSGGPRVRRRSVVRLRGNVVVHATGIAGTAGDPSFLVLEDLTEQQEHTAVMEEFIRNAAHQLRTPLTGIAAAVEVLQAGAKEIPHERDRFLDHVEQHARRLTRITRGFLMLARAELGEEIRIQRIALGPLLAELAALARPAPGVKLTVECPPDLTAPAEGELLHEALTAIVENAVLHTSTGSIRLAAGEDGDSVRISVTDTGGGVPEEHADRIFDPFFRTPGHGDGFGLGLAIAAQAVAAMDGELTVANVDGGAQFTVRLPSARPGR